MSKISSTISTKRSVKLSELIELVKKTFIANKAVAILERWSCEENQPADFFGYLSGNVNVSEWDKGRVFDNTSEIRWEREGDTFHVVLIKDDSIPSEGWEDKEEIEFVSERKVLLWGERITGKDQWYEKQVPRILEYPVMGNGSRVYAVLNEYKLNDGSTVYRFKEVRANELRKSV